MYTIRFCVLSFTIPFIFKELLFVSKKIYDFTKMPRQFFHGRKKKDMKNKSFRL